jgi:type I restriction enzyme S subunit
VSEGLPKRWTSCEIGELAQVVGGATPPSKDPTNFDRDGGVPWITPADLSAYKGIYIRQGARNLSEKGFAACSAAMLPAGTVLFSSRAPVGYVAISANPVCTNQGFKSFVLPEGLDGRFVYYYLRHIRPIAEERATGTTFKELSGAAASRLPLKIAPTNEQKRIVDKLDAVLARVDACRERLGRVPGIIKRFRQAVLTAATSGNLTEKWQESSRAHALWSKPSLGSLIAEGPKNGLYKPSTSYGYGTCILRIDNFYEGAVTSWRKLKRLDLCETERTDFGLAVGDIVVNRVNSLPYLGKAALIRELPEPCVFESNMMRIRLQTELIRPEYCILVLSSPDGLAELRANAKHAVNQASINQTDVRSLSIALPSMEEQAEIVRCVETLFAYADRLEARYAAARAQVERLTPALLAKAFRGELVPQDPDDEPASVLLERIRAARAAAPAKPKRGRAANGDGKAKRTDVPVREVRPSVGRIVKPDTGTADRCADDDTDNTHLMGALR